LREDPRLGTRPPKVGGGGGADRYEKASAPNLIWLGEGCAGI